MEYPLVSLENTANHQVLKQKAQKVGFPLSNELKDLIAFMKLRVVELGGVGLAAPQVGQSHQIIVVSISEQVKAFRKNAQDAMLPTVFINPEYEVEEGVKESLDWEGCFSVESVTGKVPRFDSIRYKAYDENGQLFEGVAQGFTARVLQHEIDHLQGVLIVDRLVEGTLRGHPKDMAALRLQDMTETEKKLMKQMIEEAIGRGEERSHYQELLALL